FFFQAEDGIRDFHVTGVQTCALPILAKRNCMNPRLAMRVGTLLAVIVLTLIALDRWRAEQEATQPMSWKPDYQNSLWLPLREGSLTLGDVVRVLGEGSLWMISADGEPRLVTRHGLEAERQS